MDYRYLGRSGLRVSALAMGTGSFQVDDVAGRADARVRVDRALEAGINLFDTADIYSAGVSESLLGAALEGRRADALVASKVRFPSGPGVNDRGLSRHHLIRSCEASLRRLRSDHIDLYQLHEWDGRTSLDETFGALDTLVTQGKVRYIGVSNFSAWHLVKACGVIERRGLAPVVSNQLHYSPFTRDAEDELLPAGLDVVVGALIWSPRAGGLLSGKYSRQHPIAEQERVLREWAEPPVPEPERLFDVVDRLVEIEDGHRATPAEVAIAWTLSRPGVTSAIIGHRTDQQLETNIRAAELTLSADEIAAIERATRPPLRYPRWHQANTAADRLSEADIAYLEPYL